MPVNYQGLKCWYCGDPANSRDHVIPKGCKLKKQRRAVVKANGSNLLPACKLCNELKGAMSVEDFHADIMRCLGMNFYFRVRDSKLSRMALKLKQFGGKFYGERGTTDCIFPKEGSKKFRYSWKTKAPRNTGDEAVRIEECAKRGPFNEVQGGLVNGK